MLIENSTLIFIANELLDPERRNVLNLPVTFITYGFVEGKMYKHYRNDGTFHLPRAGKAWGNGVVYGAVFALAHYDFYIRLLDSYHQCSLSALRANHSKDVHHRLITDVTPISFSSVDELERLKYTEREPIRAHVYTGNPNHPKIHNRLSHPGKPRYRLVDGVDKRLIKQIREELV